MPQMCHVKMDVMVNLAYFFFSADKNVIYQLVIQKVWES